MRHAIVVSFLEYAAAIAALRVAIADQPESPAAKNEAKKALLTIQKQMERYGEQYGNTLQYYLGQNTQLLYDAYEAVKKAVLALR